MHADADINLAMRKINTGFLADFALDFSFKKNHLSFLFSFPLYCQIRAAQDSRHSLLLFVCCVL